MAAPVSGYSGLWRLFAEELRAVSVRSQLIADPVEPGDA